MYLEYKIFKTILTLTALMLATGNLNAQTEKDSLNTAYSFMNSGNIEAANSIFESYIQNHPEDTKIYLQLAYNYKAIGNLKKAKSYFYYVVSNSKEKNEVDAAKSELNYISSEKSNWIFEAYSHNMYDSYQDNFITNTIARTGYLVFENFTAGGYVDVYADSKSKVGLIYNDRYIEGGTYFRYSIPNGPGFELRLGYVREIDYNKNTFNFKPVVFYGERFGTYDIYNGKKPHYYFEFYSAALYDHKFENFFVQTNLIEAMAIPFGKTVAGTFYLRQFVSADTKLFDYNNYGELAVGYSTNFKEQLLPSLFIEATNKFYFQGNPKNSFQVKAGILFNIYKQL